MISGLPTGAIYQHVSYRFSFRTLIFMCVSVWKQRMLHKRGSNIIWNCTEGITSQRVLIHEHYLLMVGWVLAKVCLLVGPTEDKSMVILFHSSWRYSVNFISAEVNWSSFLLLTIEGTHWLMQICGTYRCLSWIGKGTGVNMNTPTFKKSFFLLPFILFQYSHHFEKIIVYLAARGLGWGRQDLRSSLWRVGCSATSCELLIAACRI